MSREGEPTTKAGWSQRLWEEWKSMGKKFGDIQARVLLTLFYFVILAPFVFAVRRNDPLAIKDGAAGGWRLKGEGNGAPMQRAKRQY